MHSTRIDLTAKARTRMTGVLNARLADALDLQLQAKQAHWNVKGPSFIALHELFDRIAGETAAHVDDIAERITALGGVAEGTVQAVAGRTRLDAYPLHIVDGRSHLDALAAALAGLARDPSQRQRLGYEARRSVLEQFGEESNLQHLIGLLDGCVECGAHDHSEVLPESVLHG